MNSEKVKEIKELLRCMNGEKACTNCYINEIAQEQETFCINVVADMTLDLINELESENELLTNKDAMLVKISELTQENEELTKQCEGWVEIYQKKKKENQQLKDQISELEEYIKGNEQDAKAFVNGWRKDLETELKQFAERLKEKFYYVFGNEYEQSVSGFDTKVLIEHIDETLKEFVK